MSLRSLFNRKISGAARILAAARAGLALLNGDTAYARYLQHWRQSHSGAPLDRAAFYRSEVERRWSGVRRCC